MIKLSLAVLLLLAAIVIHHMNVRERWRKLSTAMLAASAGFIVSWLISAPLLAVLGIETGSVSGIALTKLVESVLIVAPILLVARLGGLARSDMFISRGKMKIWFLVGASGFLACAAISLFQAYAQELTIRQLLAWAPWA
jgi:hypothetical protein